MRYYSYITIIVAVSILAYINLLSIYAQELWWTEVVAPLPSRTNSPLQTPERDLDLDQYRDLGANRPSTSSSDSGACWENARPVTKVNNGTMTVVCETCDPNICNCGIKLNTRIPFIPQCIPYKGNAEINPTNAFPVLMGALIRILLSVILVVSFWALIVWWVMMTIPGQYDTWKKLAWKVIRVIASLAFLSVILYLINPNFFR